jgi:broad specificity phosphatase PhoE
MSKLKLYLLRHGETEASRDGGYCGRSDPDLTETGRQMAADFAHAYQNHPWAGIYASPMRRTRATVAPLCSLCKREPQYRDGLRELDFGEWEGKTFAETRQQYAEDYLRWLADAGWNAPAGGERGIDVARRALGVLDEIQKNHSVGDVLVVSHKATIRILLCALLGIDIGNYRDRIGVATASLAVVEFHEHGPMLTKLGDRSHLRQELRNLAGT